MRNALSDIWLVFTSEVRRVFSEKMTILVFFVATVIYPLFFCAIYYNESMTNMPVAVVDEAVCTDSKRFIHKIDATQEISVAYRCNTMEEAKRLMKEEKVHAIFYFPRDYGTRLANLETGRVGVFCDMRSFFYYKNALLGGNNVLIDEMHTIELQRFSLSGMDEQQATDMMQPVVYDNIKLYNPKDGFTSFFLPILLMLVIHQTLFFGITIMCGDANENKRALHNIPTRLRNRSIYRVAIGRSLCYILIYIPVTCFVLYLVPHMFGIPQEGSIIDIALILLPFILATTFFGITFGNLFITQRMSGILCCLFFSVILFFLSGAVWTQSNMPRFWLAISYMFPSTPGIEAYVRINSMGATLQEVKSEYIALWIQTLIYFTTACLSFRFIKKYKKA